MATLAQLFAVRDQATVLQQMYALGAQLGVDVVGVQAERMFRALFEIEATAKSGEDGQRAAIARAGFLQTVNLANTDSFTGAYIAPPNWTDLIALGWFNLTRYGAVKTVGAAQLSCNSLAAPATIPALTARFSTSSGIYFRNRDTFTIAPGTAVPLTLIAEVAGSASNVPVDSIAVINTTFAGCTVSNPGTNGSWITTVGAEAESDTNLAARCLSRWAASSYGGARSAYAQWVTDAFTSVGLAPTIPAYRIGVDDTNPNGPGSTDLYIANTAGPATAEEVALVDAYLQPRRALGTGPLRIFSAPALTIPVNAAMYGNAGGVALGNAALVALAASIGIGKVVYYSNIIAALSAPSIPGVAPPTGHVELFTPTADVVEATFQVPVFSVTLTAYP